MGKSSARFPVGVAVSERLIISFSASDIDAGVATLELSGRAAICWAEKAGW
jgi:hypothetical protein